MVVYVFKYQLIKFNLIHITQIIENNQCNYASFTFKINFASKRFVSLQFHITPSYSYSLRPDAAVGP